MFEPDTVTYGFAKNISYPKPKYAISIFREKLMHVLFGIVFCLTIIGIPFGMKQFQIAWLALVPFGKQIKKVE